MVYLVVRVQFAVFVFCLRGMKKKKKKKQKAALGIPVQLGK